jgi:hypothetical protein
MPATWKLSGDEVHRKVPDEGAAGVERQLKDLEFETL